MAGSSVQHEVNQVYRHLNIPTTSTRNSISRVGGHNQNSVSDYFGGILPAFNLAQGMSQTGIPMQKLPSIWRDSSLGGAIFANSHTRSPPKFSAGGV